MVVLPEMAARVTCPIPCVSELSCSDKSNWRCPIKQVQICSTTYKVDHGLNYIPCRPACLVVYLKYDGKNYFLSFLVCFVWFFLLILFFLFVGVFFLNLLDQIYFHNSPQNNVQQAFLEQYQYQYLTHLLSHSVLIIALNVSNVWIQRRHYKH